MKAICLLTFILITAFAPVSNKPVEQIDLNRFSGKWYSLYSIPTIFDKGTRQTTTTYTLNNDGYYNVFTTAKKNGDDELHIYRSKLFPVDDAHDGEMKAQFLWPIKIDYWVIELANDYSYVVVGHPDHKFLFIMGRKPTMDKKLYEDIVARCRTKGYPVDKLTSQYHE